jgi:hypothetical protein
VILLDLTETGFSGSGSGSSSFELASTYRTGLREEDRDEGDGDVITEKMSTSIKFFEIKSPK